MINIISSMCNDMGMVKNNENNPFGCGSFFQGDGYTTRGYFWFLPHGEHFVITKCDFYFLKDTAKRFALHFPSSRVCKAPSSRQDHGLLRGKRHTYKHFNAERESGCLH